MILTLSCYYDNATVLYHAFMMAVSYYLGKVMVT
jgi:hypothetical protein